MNWTKVLVPTVAAVVVAGTALVVRADSSQSIQVNGQALQTSHAPINQDGTIYLPLRDVAQALGATVTWDATTQTVKITTGSSTSTGSGSSSASAPSNAELSQQIQNMQALLPGLGEFMMGIQTHMAKAWYGAEAGNWDLAKFEVGEATETFDGAEASRPEDATAMKAFVSGSLTTLQTSIAAKDKSGFETNYNDTISACNACHAATIDRPKNWPNGRGFIKITTPPTSNPYNQDFNP